MLFVRDHQGEAFKHNHLLEQVRCRLPRVFYQTVKRAIRYARPSVIALGFRDEVAADGSVVPARLFADLLEELYGRTGPAYALPWVPRSQYRASVTADQVLEALRRLSFGKAVGLDGLGDRHLRDALKQDESLREKTAGLFESWLNGDAAMPPHLKVARTVMLSKDGTQYPLYGEVRVVAILPAVTKLYEQFLHRELWTQVQERHPLHELQRGFVPGGSCLKNATELLVFIQAARNRVQAQIDAGVNFQRRPKTYVVFIDLRKAFDTVNRAQLIGIMLDRGFDATVVQAFRSFCDGMRLRTDEREVLTTVGVVQGGVTSPLSFALMIDPMLVELNKLCPTLALADDLVAVCDGLLQLNLFLTTLSRLCARWSFTVNKKKSAIMEVRKDGRQRLRTGSYLGYPFVDAYKYLGILIDTRLNFGPVRASRNEIRKNLRTKEWVLRKKQLSGRARLQLWHSLFHAKYAYAHELLSCVHRKTRAWIKNALYQSLKALLRIRKNVGVD